jgi:hypothetical protein
VAPVLTGSVAERGTDLPTYDHPQLGARMKELLADDPEAGTWRARLDLIYGELNRAWTTMDLAVARPYVSDGLFDYLRYWIDAYRRRGLRNQLEHMRITSVEPARLIRDRHFDALTVRVFATGRDYVVDGKGKVVGGKKSKDRDYSEYWTLIRGSKVRGAARTAPACPNCGAPLAISMAGSCAHCQAHVTSGEFDWVLSKIEQDDSYRG